MNKAIFATALLFTLAAAPLATAAPQRIALKNDAVLRELEFDGHVWRTTRFARADGSDELKVQSDEFHVLFLDDAELTLDQLEAAGDPAQETKDGVQRITIHYVPRTTTPAPAKTSASEVTTVTITYTLGREPYPRKTVQLTMHEGQTIDRLEVERFSVAVPATRGGRGEPVFVDDRWWFGVEYPAFYSRRTDGNSPKWNSGPYDGKATFPSVIWLDGRDIEKKSRPGLIRLMHFPGATRKLADGSWGILGKTAVCGMREPGLTMELSFFDYLATIRRPIRSFVHYNNWFDPEGKKLSVENFVNKTFIPMRDGLAPYGVKIDAMVPDDGWQNRESIYEPSKVSFPHGWSDVDNLAAELEKAGTHLGIWFALNGYGLDMKWGIEHGYKEAVRNARFREYHRYFALSDPKFNAAVRGPIEHLLRDSHLNYFKHDFNDMCDMEPTGQPKTDRHGHEAEVDATIAILALERKLNPNVYQNMTNWIWFSPWWLQHCDTIWMLAGDDGMHAGFPQLSTLSMASLYRDVYLIRTWGLGVNRPLIPISDLMTAGIIYTTTLYGTEKDSIRDFSDYCMMYNVRGLKLKEWYFTPRIMTADHWHALGTITHWAEENQSTLANATLFGADLTDGKPYGYVSWNGDKAILAVRNPRQGEAEISVPFDQTMLYRGAAGREFRAQMVYPYQSEWPAQFHSGEPMKILVPGDSILVMNLEPGHATAAPPKLPPVVWSHGHLTLPDEAMLRCELQVNGATTISVDGKEIKPFRSNGRSGSQISAFDLREWHGKTIELSTVDPSDVFDAAKQVELWLMMDRPVPDKPADGDVRLPWAIAQGFRRQTMQLVEDGPRDAAPRHRMSASDWSHVRAAKLRVEVFGLQTSQGGKCTVMIGDTVLVPEVASNRGGDRWETQVYNLPADKRSLLKPSNALSLVRERDQDRFKFRGLTLAVQLADGTWVSSATEKEAQTSHPEWFFFEGRAFINPRQSQPVTLRFE